VRCQAKGFGKAAPAESESAATVCPCGGGTASLPFSRCCKPFHSRTAVPATPVALLRSRFSAYSKGLGEYVVATTHPDNAALKAGGSRGTDGKLLSTFAADVKANASFLRFSQLAVLSEVPGPLTWQVRFQYEVVVVNQDGFGSRPSARERVTETSVFTRATAEAPWLFLDSAEVHKEKLSV
jgi:SEC-C motif-containing protein